MPAKNICTECSLMELKELIREVERSDKAAMQLLTRPRTFFIQRGYFVPLHAKVSITPTEELQARLQTEQGVNAFLDSYQEMTIKIHVADGIAKCTKVEFN